MPVACAHACSRRAWWRTSALPIAAGKSRSTRRARWSNRYSACPAATAIGCAKRLPHRMQLPTIPRQRLFEIAMAWNEPGNGKRDPWKSRPQPPDLEAMLKRLRDGIGRIFRGGGGVSSGGSGGGIALIVLALIVAWIAMTSFAKIDAQQIGVVLRFG